MLLAPPAVWAPYPAGVTELSAKQFAQYSRIGIKRGFPDLMVFFGKVYGIELKTRRGRLSKTKIVSTRRGSPRVLIGQVEMHELLVQSGAWGGIAVARSVDEVCALLDKWEIPRRGGGSWLRVVNGSLRGETFARPAVDGGGSGMADS